MIWGEATRSGTAPVDYLVELASLGTMDVAKVQHTVYGASNTRNETCYSFLLSIQVLEDLDLADVLLPDVTIPEFTIRQGLVRMFLSGQE